MTPDQFRELCRETSRALQLSDPDALFTGGDVRVDGVKLGIFHDERWDHAGIYCYADLGAIKSTANATHVMEEVLALNLELDASQGEGVGMERESKHLVLRARLAECGEQVHGGQVADQLRGYAALANELYQKVLTEVSRPA